MFLGVFAGCFSCLFVATFGPFVQAVQCQISSSILTAITSSSISPQTTRWSSMLCKHDCFNMLQGSSVFDLHIFYLRTLFWIRSIRHDQTDDVKLFCWACSSLVPQKPLFPTLDVFFSTEVQVANVLTKDCCTPILHRALWKPTCPYFQKMTSLEVFRFIRPTNCHLDGLMTGSESHYQIWSIYVHICLKSQFQEGRGTYGCIRK